MAARTHSLAVVGGHGRSAAAAAGDILVALERAEWCLRAGQQGPVEARQLWQLGGGDQNEFLNTFAATLSLTLTARCFSFKLSTFTKKKVFYCLHKVS